MSEKIDEVRTHARQRNWQDRFGSGGPRIGTRLGGGDKTTFRIQPLLWCLDSVGPIWVAGSWHGAPHVIVVTGARAGKAPVIWYINPWSLHGGSEDIQTSLSWLNGGGR